MLNLGYFEWLPIGCTQVWIGDCLCCPSTFRIDGFQKGGSFCILHFTKKKKSNGIQQFSTRWAHWEGCSFAGFYFRPIFSKISCQKTQMPIDSKAKRRENNVLFEPNELCRFFRTLYFIHPCHVYWNYSSNKPQPVEFMWPWLISTGFTGKNLNSLQILIWYLYLFLFSKLAQVKRWQQSNPLLASIKREKKTNQWAWQISQIASVRVRSCWVLPCLGMPFVLVGEGVLPISITKERPKELTDRVSLTLSLAHVD